jgi:putative tryptophan/tyrosine transport system substrate-binding protein
VIGRRTFSSGALALAAAPLAARAQVPGKTYRIAVWATARPVTELNEDSPSLGYRAFFRELRRLGFVEGQNLIVQRYSSGGRSSEYAVTAREIVNTRPDVIVTVGIVGLRLLLSLTGAIPIVAPATADPLAAGLVRSLARPEANLTGFTIDGGLEINGLRLQLIKEAAPRNARLAFLTTSYAAAVPGMLDLNRGAAAALGIDLSVHAMDGTFDEINFRTTFARIAAERVGGIHVGSATELIANLRVIVALAAEHRIPAIYESREFVEAGGLMSYGVDLGDNWRKGAGYVARILHGAKPSDLPIQQPTTFEVLVNLKTAKALGITLPESIMIRATEVIE